MKGLLVLNQREGRRSTADAQARLAAQCQAMGWEWETYLYGEGDLESFAAQCDLCGTVYLQQAEACGEAAVVRELERLWAEQAYDGLFLASGSQGQYLSTQLATGGTRSFLNGVNAMEWKEETLFCEKMVYNNYFLGQYRLKTPFVVQEKLPQPRRAVYERKPRTCIWCGPAENPACILEQTVLEESGEHDVSPVLLVVGMGVGEKKDVERIRAFCMENRFDFGVTRPVAMRGWGSMDELIGVSGRICAPKVTITIGVSGSAAFFVGIEHSDYILAINTNERANIASQCDALIQDDYTNVLEPLFACLRPYRREAL